MKRLLCLLPILGMLSACEAFCHEPTSTPTEKKIIRDDIKTNPQIVNPNP